MNGCCELCSREVALLTEHHLKPRSRLRRGENSDLALLCPACHKQIHSLFTNHQLASEYNSVARLRDEPRLAKFLKWVVKQDPNKRVKVKR